MQPTVGQRRPALSLALALNRVRFKGSVFGVISQRPMHPTTAYAQHTFSLTLDLDHGAAWAQTGGGRELQQRLEGLAEYTPAEVEKLVRMQYQMRCRWLPRYKTRFSRELLTERLSYERKFTFGFLFLLNQVAIFFLIIGSLYLGGSESAEQGLSQEIKDAFDFEGLHAVASREGFVSEALPHIARASKRHFVLSSQYWDTRDKGAIELIAPLTLFTSPKLLRGVQVNMNVDAFSWTSWVKLLPQAASGAYVVRKRVGSLSGPASSALSCWGLYWHSVDGPSFIFGAHDYFDTSSLPLESAVSGSAADAPVEESVRVSAAALARRNSTLVKDDYSFITVTANSTHMSFYVDSELLETRVLQRLVTDCWSSEGLYIGDTGLSLGKLNFYPGMLSQTQIREIYEGGATLADMSTGSDPAEPDPVPPVVSSAVFDATDYARNLVVQAAAQTRKAEEALAVATRSPAAPHGNIPVQVSGLALSMCLCV